MAGSISLSGMAALRGGAGLVNVAVPDVCLETVAGFEPSYMTVPLPCDDQGRIAGAAREALQPYLEEATCIACGPGLGQTDDLRELVEWIFTTVDKPVVIDADGLNNLAKRSEPLAGAAGLRILTPHPGEFGRLAGEKLSTAAAHSRAVDLAKEHGVVMVLKGSPTFVTDGSQKFHNTTGNPGLATGGTGDVLTGLITAMVCQRLSPFDAACLAVHVHGRAGDLAAGEFGQVAMIASDLLKHVPAALQEVS
jgi:ADP-dependent NAD(P)H-hydrate dehydratase